MGRPRRPPGISRVQAAGSQLRRSEHQHSNLRMPLIRQTSCRREWELASSAPDVRAPHHDRRFGDLDSLIDVVFSGESIPRDSFATAETPWSPQKTNASRWRNRRMEDSHHAPVSGAKNNADITARLARSHRFCNYPPVERMAESERNGRDTPPN